MRICKLCLLNTKQPLLVDYCFGKVTKIMWITFCLKYICGLNYKILSTSPSNMPHLIYFIPALFFIAVLKSFSSQTTDLWVFSFYILPWHSPSHCESTSTPEALKSHQALLHLSLHYCLHLKIVPFLCVSVTLIPSTAAVLSQVPLSSVVTFLWEAPICQWNNRTFWHHVADIQVLIWGSLEPERGTDSTIDHHPSLSLLW